MVDRNAMIRIAAVLFSFTAAAFAQCPAVEFDARTTVTTDPNYVTGIAQLAPGNFVAVEVQQQPPHNLLQYIPHMERQLIYCYQRNTLGTATPAKDYSAGEASMPVNMAHLDSAWTIGAISLGIGNLPAVQVVSGTPPLQFTTNTSYELAGGALSGLFVDVNNDGHADLVVVEENNAGTAAGIAVLIANADGTFQAPVTYPAGSSAVSVCAGDFNGDGKIDLAVAAGATILLLPGNGDGSFGAASSVAPSTSGLVPRSVAAADINGDGRLDLIATTSTGVFILLGSGSGSFTASPEVPLNNLPSFTAIGDFNGDGKPDLAVASPNSSTVSVFLGKGDGTFGPEVRYAGPSATSYLVITDVNGDGKPDIAVAQGTPAVFAADDGSGTVTTLIGNGDGTFQASLVYSTGGTDTDSFLASADFNNDGKPDLIGANASLSSTQPVHISTFLNQGNGKFGAGIQTAVPFVRDLAVGDFNGDGNVDVAVANGSVALLFGKGDGTFSSGPTLSGITSANELAAGDFNGDGKPDLVVASLSSAAGVATPGVAIALNTGNGAFSTPVNLSNINAAQIVTGDFNRDGKLDIAAGDLGQENGTSGGILILLGNGDGTFHAEPEIPIAVFNTGRFAVGDLNGDGIPDIAIGTGASQSPSPSGYNVALFFGNGDGTFQAPTYLETAPGPGNIAIADLNGDGQPDLIIGHCCGNGVPAYRLNNGDGTFPSEVGVQTGGAPEGLIATDLNGDGKPDLAVADTSAGLAVLINHTATSPFTSVSAAGYLDAPLAPNSIVTGFGAGLGSAPTSATSLPLPTELAGASINVTDSTGASNPASLFYAAPTQLNYLLPASVAPGMAELSISGASGSSTEQIQVLPFAPSLFTLGAGNLVAGYLTLVSGGNTTTEPIYQVAGGQIVAAPITPPTGSDQLILTVFGTGLRNYQGTFYAIVGNQFQPVSYAGAQGSFVGLDQVDIQLPSTLPSGVLPVIVGTFGGGVSNTTSITVQ